MNGSLKVFHQTFCSIIKDNYPIIQGISRTHLLWTNQQHYRTCKLPIRKSLWKDSNQLAAISKNLRKFLHLVPCLIRLLCSLASIQLELCLWIPRWTINKPKAETSRLTLIDQQRNNRLDLLQLTPVAELSLKEDRGNLILGQWIVITLNKHLRPK